MREAFARELRCPCCGGALSLDARLGSGESVEEGALRSACGRVFPVIASVPRVLPDALAGTLVDAHGDFFRRHQDLRPPDSLARGSMSARTLRAFGDEWQRFPELLAVHERIFRWYFEGASVEWRGLRVLDAGCGMGRWLHFAAAAGARIVGMDVSPAIDVVARRETSVDLVQADLTWAPFAPSSFALVYSFGVVHHLEDPAAGVRSLATLVEPGGSLRLYVYRTLDGDSAFRRALLAGVTLLRRSTTRLPFFVLHAVCVVIGVIATGLFLWPRRVLRGSAWGDRVTRGLPLVQYVDVPFRMLVAEQFDRFAAPIENRHRREEVERWLRSAGFEIQAILPELGWRAVARRPSVD